MLRKIQHTWSLAITHTCTYADERTLLISFISRLKIVRATLHMVKPLVHRTHQTHYTLLKCIQFTLFKNKKVKPIVDVVWVKCILRCDCCTLTHKFFKQKYGHKNNNIAVKCLGESYASLRCYHLNVHISIDSNILFRSKWISLLCTPF